MKQRLFENTGGNQFRLNKEIITEGLMKKLLNLPLAILAGTLLVSPAQGGTDTNKPPIDSNHVLRVVRYYQRQNAPKFDKFQDVVNHVTTKYQLTDEHIQKIVSEINGVYDRAKSKGKTPAEITQIVADDLKALADKYKTHADQFLAKGEVGQAHDAESSQQYQTASNKFEGYRIIIEFVSTLLKNVTQDQSWESIIQQVQSPDSQKPPQ